MMPDPTINCPGSVDPGSTVRIKGTAECDTAKATVTHNGSRVPVSNWECENGDYSFEFVAPQCVEPPGENTVDVTVGDSNGEADCVIDINCP